MFTINIYLRFALIGIFLLGGTILAFLGNIGFGFWYALPLLIVGLVFLVGYILLGTVQSAAVFMQNADFEKTEARLNLTFNPKWLYATNRAYFYIMKGSIALARKDTEEGEMWLKKAEEINVPTDNESAMIQLQLGNIAASKNKWKQAQLHFRNAKQKKITDPNLKEQLKQFEKALTNRGQMKAATRMGKQGSQMIRQGGKRRRPKMK